MTNQEAIEWIKEHHATDLDGCKDSTAMRMAVEALQREIDFDNAIEKAYDHGYDVGYTRGAMDARGVFE